MFEHLPDDQSETPNHTVRVANGFSLSSQCSDATRLTSLTTSPAILELKIPPAAAFFLKKSSFLITKSGLGKLDFVLMIPT